MNQTNKNGTKEFTKTQRATTFAIVKLINQKLHIRGAINILIVQQKLFCILGAPIIFCRYLPLTVKCQSKGAF